MISAVVLTYNEEGILGQCLEALSFVDHILVFDSFSTDRTLEVAKKHRAVVVQREFDDYASQRNAALASVPEKYDWVVMVDADEIVTPELQKEILLKVSESKETTLFRVRRKDMFQNRWIKQSSGYPTWFPRVFRNGTVTVTREINEEYETTGHIENLKEHLVHYPFNKGMSWWFEKHNRYSAMEAKKMLEELKEPIPFSYFFSKDPMQRRKAQKRLVYRLPFRPQLIFIFLYFVRGGFRNGKAGYTFCRLRQSYEWMIDVKFKGLKAGAEIDLEMKNVSRLAALTSHLDEGEKLPNNGDLALKKVNLSTYDNSWYKPASRLKAVLWYATNVVFFKGAFPYPYRMKRWILRLYGCQVGKKLVIKPHVSIKYPWLLEIGDNVWIGEHVWIDNLAEAYIASNVCISQGAMLLGGNHDYSSGTFDLMIGPIILEEGAWIGAKAVICPGVTCHSHAILGVGGVATKNLEPYGIYMGNPAVKVRERQVRD